MTLARAPDGVVAPAAAVSRAGFPASVPLALPPWAPRTPFESPRPRPTACAADSPAALPTANARLTRKNHRRGRFLPLPVRLRRPGRPSLLPAYVAPASILTHVRPPSAAPCD